MRLKTGVHDHDVPDMVTSAVHKVLADSDVVGPLEAAAPKIADAVIDELGELVPNPIVRVAAEHFLHSVVSNTLDHLFHRHSSA